MADPYYQNLERQLRDMRMRVHDSFDKPGDPTARIIHNELQKAEDMAQSQHNLRSIEERLRATQNLLKRVDHAPSHERVMSVEHADHFHDHLEHMRMDLRRHPRF